MYELVGVLTKSSKSLMSSIRRYVNEGLIEVDDLGFYVVTDLGMKYLEVCSNKELRLVEVKCGGGH